MADQEHLKRLQQGKEVWNTWRKGPQESLQIDLSRANLRHDDLRYTNLRHVNLIGADLGHANLGDTDLDTADLRYTNLRHVNLIGANLIRADLGGADLTRADLSDAHLSGANLGGANLDGANLTRTDLSGTSLVSANLSGADLSRANLSRASVGWTVFGNLDLRTAKGLETLEHKAPSIIGTDTLERSQGALPEIFLRKAGVHDSLITYARSLFQAPIQFYTCFISYSSQDQAFIDRLYADLQSKDVRCWYAPEDLKPGELIRQGIDEAIRRYDKFLLVLSEHAVESAWVGFEVEAAMERERREKRTVLYPIRLDDCVMDTGQAWAADLRRTRHIGDFRRWKEHDAYQERLRRLLGDLQPGSAKIP